MDEAEARVYAAAALSPLSIMIALPVAGSMVGMLSGGHLEILAWIKAAGFFLALAYPAMLIIGFPTYLILRRLKLDRLWTAMIVGYLTAAVVPIILHAHGVPPSTPAYWLNPFFFLGTLVGFVFWWVAKPRPKTSR